METDINIQSKPAYLLCEITITDVTLLTWTEKRIIFFNLSLLSSDVNGGYTLLRVVQIRTLPTMIRVSEYNL